MIKAIGDIPSLKGNVIVDEVMVSELYLDIGWDQSAIKLTIEQFAEELKNGSPFIRIRMLKFAGERAQLSATVLSEGQELVVGKRVREIFLSHTK